MGGYGSGNFRAGAKTTVEACRSLRVGELVRHRVVRPDVHLSVNWQWSYEGEVRASVRLAVVTGADEGVLHVAFSSPVVGPSRHMYRLTTVRLVSGGLRWYLRCLCDRRVRALYLPPGRLCLGCRTCHELVYQSTKEPRNDALFAKVGSMMGWTGADVRKALRRAD